MTIITNTVASKLFVGFVAIAMALSLVAPAQAATEAEELEAQIAELFATINTLQAQLGDAPATTGSSASVCPYQWSRSLNTGATGADVMALQKFLNADANTMVAATGVGSAGMETDYYGGLTAAAVSNFQVMYRDDILTPVNLVNPTGYFGPSTMAKANELCASAPVVVDDTMDDTDDTTDDSDDTMDDVSDLQGEGTLATFEIDDDEDEVEEGDEDVVVLVATAEAEDGDVLLSRLEMQLIGNEDNDEVDPWDVFDEVSLWVDGDKVAEFDASDEDEYLDEDAGTFRFSGLDLILPEDEEVEMRFSVSAANSVDGAGSAAEWNLDVLEARTFDADDVADTDSFGDMGDDDAATQDSAGVFSDLDGGIDFDIVAEGDGDELDLARSSNDPDETTLIADEDEDYGIFAFELDADGSDGDIEINMIDIDVVLSSTTGALDDVISDFYIEIEGDKFSAESYTGTGDTATLEFDVDGDYVVKADEDAEVWLYAEVDEMDDASDYQGVTIAASLDTDQVDAEGAADITVGGSDQDGEAHPIRSTGIAVTYDDETSYAESEGNTLTFEFIMNIEAFGADSVLTESDFNYTLASSSGATPSVEVTLDATSEADEDPAGTFTLGDGDEATYTFTVFVTSDESGDQGLVEITLDDVDGTDVDESLEKVLGFSS